MSNDCITKEAAIAEIKADAGCAWCCVKMMGCCSTCSAGRKIRRIEEIPPADVLPVPPGGIGEVSDGFHTFNGLYYQRMILFAALVKQNREKAWKSYKHSDGEPCFGGGWFIVGIDTLEGSYTYHYKNEHFDLFDCQELPVGKPWDGHTEKDVTRLLSLPPAPSGEWVTKLNVVDKKFCSQCNYPIRGTRVYNGYWFVEYNFCPNCGAIMKKRSKS